MVTERKGTVSEDVVSQISIEINCNNEQWQLHVHVGLGPSAEHLGLTHVQTAKNNKDKRRREQHGLQSEESAKCRSPRPS